MYRLLVWVKDLVLVKLDIANYNDLAILKDLDTIDVAALIADEIANIYP